MGPRFFLFSDFGGREELFPRKNIFEKTTRPVPVSPHSTFMILQRKNISEKRHVRLRAAMSERTAHGKCGLCLPPISPLDRWSAFPCLFMALTTPRARAAPQASDGSAQCGPTPPFYRAIIKGSHSRPPALTPWYVHTPSVRPSAGEVPTTLVLGLLRSGISCCCCCCWLSTCRSHVAYHCGCSQRRRSSRNLIGTEQKERNSLGMIGT